MKRIFFLTIVFGLFLIPCLAQEIKQENSVCIELKNANLSVDSNKVLVAGSEVISPQFVSLRKPISTLRAALAAVGGLKRKTSIRFISVFNCSLDSAISEDVIVTDYEKIKSGIEPDLELKGGEIIIVQDKSSKEFPSVLPLFEPRCSSGCGVCNPPKSF